MKRGNKIPYWLKGILFSILVLAATLFIGALTSFIGPRLFGMFIILTLLSISSIISSVVVELISLVFPINLKLVEGGGSPTLTAQLLALVVYIFLSGFIGWVYGKCKQG